MLLFEVLTLSAANLPNVRKLSTGKTRAWLVLEGPLAEPYRTEVDMMGGLNPTWETPFTVSLHSRAQLKATVFIKRTARRNKPIATVLVSLKDFAGPSGGSHEYTLLTGEGRQEREEEAAKLKISARLFGGRQEQRHKSPPSPAAMKEYSGGMEYTIGWLPDHVVETGQ